MRTQVTITLEDDVFRKIKKKCVDEKTNLSYKIQELIEQYLRGD